MYTVKEVYKFCDRTIYYIVSNKDTDIKMDAYELARLVNKGIVSNAKIEIRNNIEGLYVYDTNVIESDNIIELYHISIDKPSEKVYKPRVPSSASIDEDRVTPRICLSTSIEGCLTAFNMEVHDLERAILNKPIYLLKTIISENDSRLLKPEYLYDANLVLDTPVTDEHWYTGALIPKVGIIEIIDFDTDFKNVAREKDREAVYEELKKAGVTSEILKGMDRYSVTDLVNYKIGEYNKYLLSKEIDLDLTEIIYCANIIKNVEHKVIV